MNRYRYALRFAEQCHRGVSRKFTDEPYFLHVVRVSAIVGEIFGRESAISIAGLGHDILEDCELTPLQVEEMHSIFGDAAMRIIKEVTNVSSGPEFANKSREEKKAADFAKIAEISIFGKVLKAADRLDNISEIHNSPKKWRDKYIAESFELFEILKNKIPTQLSRELYEALIYARSC